MKTETISAIFNLSEIVSIDMGLFVQFVIGSAISSCAILIILAGISYKPEFLLQSISSRNFMTSSVLTSSNLKLKEF